MSQIYHDDHHNNPQDDTRLSDFIEEHLIDDDIDED